MTFCSCFLAALVKSVKQESVGSRKRTAEHAVSHVTQARVHTEQHHGSYPFKKETSQREVLEPIELITDVCSKEFKVPTCHWVDCFHCRPRDVRKTYS